MEIGMLWFNSLHINNFFNKNLYNSKDLFVSPCKETIYELLKLLDKKGKKTSMMGMRKEAKILKLDTNEYISKNERDCLKQVSVEKHALLVADIAYKKVTQNEGEWSTSEIQSIIISALAHDIGKINGVGKQKHPLLSHEISSICILEQMQSFSYLDSTVKKTIIDDITNHYNFPTNLSRTGCVLQSAIQIARCQELENFGQDVCMLPAMGALEGGWAEDAAT